MNHILSGVLTIAFAFLLVFLIPAVVGAQGYDPGYEPGSGGWMAGYTVKNTGSGGYSSGYSDTSVVQERRVSFNLDGIAGSKAPKRKTSAAVAATTPNYAGSGYMPPMPPILPYPGYTTAYLVIPFPYPMPYAYPTTYSGYPGYQYPYQTGY